MAEARCKRGRQFSGLHEDLRHGGSDQRPELGLPDDIAHVLGDVIMATLPGRCRWEDEA